MNAVPTPPSDDRVVRWGMGDAAAGWLIAQGAALVLGALILTLLGYGAGTTTDDLSLGAIALTYPPLWLGFIGVPIWAAAPKGRGWIEDFRVAIRWTDVPLGIVAGVVAQIVLVPLVSWPILELTGKTVEDLSGPAEALGDKAHGAGGAVLLILLVAIGAPIAEELFFRGLLLRSIERRFGLLWAVVGSSVVFGATHFQPLQLAGLTAAGLVFALLAVRTGRLGPAILAHMAFNGLAVANLIWGFA